jgi:hypothetical protein
MLFERYTSNIVVNEKETDGTEAVLSILNAT